MRRIARQVALSASLFLCAAACGHDASPGASDAARTAADALTRARGASASSSADALERPGVVRGAAGSFEVSPQRGEVTSTIALPPLPRRAGFGAELALRYVSTPADLLDGMGIGWSLGLPSVAINGDLGVPAYGYVGSTTGFGYGDIAARLSLGGARLVLVAEHEDRIAYRLDGGEEDVLVDWYRDAPTTLSVRGAPGGAIVFQGFVVRYPDGRQELYTADPSAVELHPAYAFPTKWPLAYTISPTQDVVAYTHERADDGRTYVRGVSFAGGRSRYVFDRAPRANDHVGHAMGYPQGARYLYTRVTALFDDAPMHTWCLAYAAFDAGGPKLETHDDCRALAATELAPEIARLGSSLARQDQLLAVYRFGASPTPFGATTPRSPTLRFRYSDATLADLGGHGLVYEAALPDVAGFGPEGGAELVDIDADGLVDVLRYVAREQASVPSFNSGDLSAASTFAASAPVRVEKVVDGVVTGEAPRFDEASGRAAYLRGDFDGDGRTDLVAARADDTDASRSKLALYAGRGARVTPFGRADGETDLALSVHELLHGRTQVVDLNADGKSDLLVAIPGAVESTLTAFVNVSRPGSPRLALRKLEGLPFPFERGAALDHPSYHFADANGDGLTDLLRVTVLAGGETGLCVYENQAPVWAYPFFDDQDQRAGLYRDLLFGASDAADAQCGRGYFLRVPDAPSSTGGAPNLNAMWTLDVNQDGFVDFVNVAPSGGTLAVWLGRGPGAPFDAARTLTLDAPVSVDPNNKWNTRVLDVDGDGADEILVYEQSANGGKLKVIDFNRQGSKNRIGPGLLVEAREGTALADAFHYGTSTDELVRDRRRAGDAAVAHGLPFGAVVAKRHIHRVGASAPAIWEYQYHAPAFDGAHREFLGFGSSETLEFGDVTTPSLVTRRVYTRSGDDGARYLADKVSREEQSSAALSEAQRRRLEAIGDARVASLDDASATSETWSEEPFAAATRHAVHEEVWTALPRESAATRPTHFVRLASTRDAACGVEDACASPATSTRAYEHDAENRVRVEHRTASAVPGPNGTTIPAQTFTRTLTYDESWASRGVRLAIRTDSLTSLSPARIVAATTTTYAADLPLPERVERLVHVDSIAAADLPAALREILPAGQTRIEHYAYDAFGNAIEVSDALGARGGFTYDASGVRLLEARNALGHQNGYCYGAGECAQAIDPADDAAPLHALDATHVRTPQGDLQVTRYDALHRPVRLTDRGGREISYAYRDADGASPALVAVTERRASEAALAPSRHLFALRADGVVVGEASADEGDGARVLSSSELDRRGGRVFEAVPFATTEGVEALFAAGRFPRPPSTACAVGAGSCVGYDAMARPVRRVDASGRALSETTHEAWGRRTVETRTEAAGPVTRSRSEVARDGQVHALVDERGEVTRFERDDVGALRGVLVPGERAPRTFVHDTEGDLVASLVPGGLSRVWIRDARGRVVEERTWDTSLAHWERVENTYDALDRATRTVASSSARATAWSELTFTFDRREGQPEAPEQIGRLLERVATDHATGHAAVETFAYDARGRTTARHLGYAGPGITRSYDEQWTYALDGSLSSYRDPFGNELASTLGPSGMPTAISWTAPGRAAAALITGLAYDARGQIAAYTAPRATLSRSAVHAPDTGLLLGLRGCLSGRDCATRAAQDIALTRYADGRVATAREGERTTSYVYGTRGELASATRTGGAEYSYAYGAGGQVLSLDEGAPTPFAPAAEGTAHPPLPANGNYRLDGFGRVIAGFDIRAIDYDPWGRIRRVETGAATIAYVYSAGGLRVAKHVTSGGAARPIVVYPTPLTRDDGHERQSIVRAAGQRLALLVDEARSFALLDDALGVTRALVDERGETVVSATYSPYGRADIAWSGAPVLASTELVFAFTGQLADPDTGLVHMGAREYAPALASFTSPDPFALEEPELCAESPLECHLYTYVGHDPINFVDEDGHSRERASSNRSATNRAGTNRTIRPHPKNAPAHIVAARPRHPELSGRQEAAARALSPLRQAFPGARVGFRGSLARGIKGEHKLWAAWNPQEFDVDAFIVSDALAATVARNADNFRNLARLPENRALLWRLSAAVKQIPGVKQKDTFKVRVFTEAEFERDVGTDERFFLR